MSAKETHDIERMEGLLTAWQVLATQSTNTPAQADPVDEEPPPFDLQWAAGLFDGEGCIHIVCQRKAPGKPPTYHLRVCMTQNDLQVLEHFQRGMGVGGHIYLVARKPWHSRQVYTLNFATAQSVALLKRLAPYLVRKRNELALARRFWTEGMSGVRRGPKGMSPEVRALREQLYLEMKRVKRAPV